MWFAYLDESKEDNKFFVYSALVLNGDNWNDAFAAVKTLRKHLRDAHGIYIKQELHASKFAAGKGRVSSRVLDLEERAVAFKKVMRFITNCRFFAIISSVNTNEFMAFDRLINRLNRTAERKGHHVLLFCDEGQEVAFTRRMRRMRVFNPIWSNRGVWEETGQETRNIPTVQMIEDPIFKDSQESYFIQLVDFCAFALLRSERPLPSKTALGYDQMYELLRPITASVNNRKDPRGLGIIR